MAKISLISNQLFRLLSNNAKSANPVYSTMSYATVCDGKLVTVNFKLFEKTVTPATITMLVGKYLLDT